MCVYRAIMFASKRYATARQLNLRPSKNKEHRNKDSKLYIVFRIQLEVNLIYCLSYDPLKFLNARRKCNNNYNR